MMGLNDEIKSLQKATVQSKNDSSDLVGELNAVISRLKNISKILIGKKRESSVDNAKNELERIADKMKHQGMATAHVDKAVSLMGNSITKRDEDKNKSVKGHFNGVIDELEAAKNDVK